MSTTFNDRKIHVLEAPGVKYQDSQFETYPKALLQAVGRKEISHQAMTLWLTVSELAGHDREAFAGLPYLCEKLGVKESSIQRWTKELEQTGWMVKINRTATSNKYFLCIPAEFDVLHPDYSPRLSTVSDEITRSKRRTHKVKNDSMELDTSNSSHKVTDDSIDKVTDDLLKRQSIKETEHNDTELTKMDQGVTTVNQGRSLAETLDSPLVSSGQDYKEILVEEIAVLSSGETKSPGYSSVTSKEEEISSGMAIVNEDDLGKTDKVQKAMEDYRAKKAKRSAWQVPSKKTEPLEVVDASLSASGAKDEAKVQEIPVKPQKPVWTPPERRESESDDDYESRVWRAGKAHTILMTSWKDATDRWEAQYGDKELPPLSDEGKAKIEAMRFRAQAY